MTSDLTQQFATRALGLLSSVVSSDDLVQHLTTVFASLFEVVELVGVCGFYRFIASIAVGFDVPMPPHEGPLPF